MMRLINPFVLIEFISLKIFTWRVRRKYRKVRTA
jgi:hypothetical protein